MRSNATDDHSDMDESSDGDQHYGLRREVANDRRGAGWWVNLRRRGRRISRLFKDSVYGSEDAAKAQAIAYRNAVIEALPPLTNHEQAVRLRSTNQSGISGVRFVETDEGGAWQATLLTNEGQKRETYSIAKYGEQAAKSMAISKRRQWLEALPVRHLTYAQHAEEVARAHFSDQLIPVRDVLPELYLSAEDVDARLAAIEARFDAAKPKRLRVSVKDYGAGRLALAVSNAAKPAKRRLIYAQLTNGDVARALHTLRQRAEAAITEFYDATAAAWFMEAYGNALFDPQKFDLSQGFNILVLLPPDMQVQTETLG